MGRAIVLLVPGSVIPLPNHGIPPGRRPDDNADQVRYILGGRYAILHCGMRARYRSCT